jgi:hypothetical protein
MTRDEGLILPIIYLTSYFYHYDYGCETPD